MNWFSFQKTTHTFNWEKHFENPFFRLGTNPITILFPLLVYVSGSQSDVREKYQGVRQFKNNTKIFNETTH